MDGSRATLALEGLMGLDSPEGDDRYELQRRVLNGRYQEIRMLLFLGKDISRWLQQCVDFARRADDMTSRYSEQSFATLIVESPPGKVKEKLEKWGVSDRRAVFSRAIGIYSMFSEPPSINTLAPTFLNHYHRYADHAYRCHYTRGFRIRPVRVGRVFADLVGAMGTGVTLPGAVRI